MLIIKYKGSRHKQWSDNPHRPRVTPTTTTTTTTTTRKPYTRRYHSDPIYPIHVTTDRPQRYPNDPHYPATHPKDPQYPKYPYYPKDPQQHPKSQWPRRDHPHYPRVFTDRPDEEYTKKPTKEPKRYYPEKPIYRHHSEHRPTHPPKRDDKPETCNTSYDAITIIRGELFIFKDRVCETILYFVKNHNFSDFYFSIIGALVNKDYSKGIHMRLHECGENYLPTLHMSILFMRIKKGKLYFS